MKISKKAVEDLISGRLNWPDEIEAANLLLRSYNFLNSETFCKLVESCPYTYKWIEQFNKARRRVDNKIMIFIKRTRIFDNVFLHSPYLYSFNFRKSFYREVVEFISKFEYYSSLVSEIDKKIALINNLLGDPDIFRVKTSPINYSAVIYMKGKMVVVTIKRSACPYICQIEILKRLHKQFRVQMNMAYPIKSVSDTLDSIALAIALHT